MIAGWSQFFKPSVAPFRWEPERVVTNAAGDRGFSSGPVFDETGRDRHLYFHVGKRAGWLVENPFRRRLCLSDDEAINTVTGLLVDDRSKLLSLQIGRLTC